MNIFFVMQDGTLVTPPLGTILPGITRSSLITLAQDAGMQVEERAYSFKEWQGDAASGRLWEALHAAPPPSSRPSATFAMPSVSFPSRAERSAL